MGSQKLDVKFEPFPDEIHNRIRDAFPNTATPVRTSPGNFVIPATYEQFAEQIFNFPLDEKDVWVVTFPKSGTTWTQEQVWLLSNNSDFEGAKKLLHERFPFLEMGALPSEEWIKIWAESMKNAPLDGTPHSPPMLPADIAKLSSPRYVKSHLPFYLLPPKLIDTCKVVYVARNPKDVCVSWFYHHQLMKFMQTQEPFEIFMDFFLNDKLMYSPYWAHVKAAWELRNHPNFLFLFYEDMKADLPGELKKIADFLGKSYTEDEYKRLKSHLVIDQFKKNPAVNNEAEKKIGLFNEDGNFIRKGKTGNWSDHFTPEMNKKFDAWIEMNSKDTDLRFKYELESQD